MGHKCYRNLFVLLITLTGLLLLFIFTLQVSFLGINGKLRRNSIVLKDVEKMVQFIKPKDQDYYDSNSGNNKDNNKTENVTLQKEKDMVNHVESQNLKPHPIFPGKNNTELKATLKEIDDILQPIFEEITKKVTQFKGMSQRKVKNLTAVQNVINGFEKHYFRWEIFLIYSLF